MRQKLFHKQRNFKSKIKLSKWKVLKSHFQQRANLKMNRFRVLRNRNLLISQTPLYLKSNYLENLLCKLFQKKKQVRLAKNSNHNKTITTKSPKLNNLCSKKLIHRTIHQIILSRKIILKINKSSQWDHLWTSWRVFMIWRIIQLKIM